MTKTIATAMFLVTCAAGGVMAATAADSNGDGLLTITEIQAVLPDVSAELFTAMDLNADGALDAAEIEAAQEAGLLPA